MMFSVFNCSIVFTVRDTMDCSPWIRSQAPLDRGILQARILEWVVMPSSRGTSQTKDRTQISHTSGIKLSLLHCRWILYHLSHQGNQEYWNGWPTPSPRDLPNPWIEPGSPALQVDSLPAKLPGKPKAMIMGLFFLFFHGNYIFHVQPP